MGKGQGRHRKELPRPNPLHLLFCCLHLFLFPLMIVLVEQRGWALAVGFSRTTSDIVMIPEKYEVFLVVRSLPWSSNPNFVLPALSPPFHFPSPTAVQGKEKVPPSQLWPQCPPVPGFLGGLGTFFYLDLLSQPV